MREIEIGDYIRTTFGIITKIVRIEDTMLRVGGFVNGIGGTHEHRMQKGKLFRTNHGATVLQEEIKKNSKNIIDLIEVGDYVNGEKVEEIFEDGLIYYHAIRLQTNKNDFLEQDIISIATKEQFENIEYRLRDEYGD